jgi:hypothetical protein
MVLSYSKGPREPLNSFEREPIFPLSLFKCLGVKKLNFPPSKRPIAERRTCRLWLWWHAIRAPGAAVNPSSSSLFQLARRRQIHEFIHPRVNCCGHNSLARPRTSEQAADTRTTGSKDRRLISAVNSALVESIQKNKMQLHYFECVIFHQSFLPKKICRFSSF